MPFVPIIGLEIHIQLKTESKMFCGCPTSVEAHTAPNTNICPICLGHPGVLPVPNAQAMRFAALFGLAIEGAVAQHSKFDRKNYFYPDLPKGYQISQFDLPVIAGGHLDVDVPGADRPRGGTPLLECVTEPDLRGAEEAKAFLQELRLLVRTLGVSEGDMEKGHLRCDANISLREVDAKGDVVGSMFNPKTEVKNINSFRNVERALQYEIQRQTKLWEEGKPPMITTTRGWDDVKQRTVMQRTKEEAADYRYFPEPDIPPLTLGEIAEEMRAHMSELPAEKRLRFQEEYGFTAAEIRQLTEDGAMAAFTEQVMSELSEWLPARQSESDGGDEERREKMTKLVASWLINKLGSVHENVSAENFAELLKLMTQNQVTSRSAVTILEEMKQSGKDPSQVMEDAGLGRMDDEAALADVVDRVLAGLPGEVERYKAGETKLIKFFMGVVMKETEGNADPASITKILQKKLSL